MSHDLIDDFIIKPENLALALEIAARVGRLRDRAHRSFWPAAETALNACLAPSNMVHHWEIRGVGPDAYRQDWSSIAIRPRSCGPLFLRVLLQQSTASSRYALAYGVSYSSPGLSESVPEIEILKKDLQGRGFSSQDWWAARKALDIHILDARFLLRLYNEQEKFIDELVGAAWELFERVHPKMEMINVKLAELG